MQDLREFVAGFQRFQKNYFHGDNTLFKVLRQGQNPRALVIACCDSRADPALIADCSPGDMFVIRNVANLVPPHCPDQNCHGVSSAIEYAVRDLQVEHIVVLGHSHCGGINALMHPTEQVKHSQFVSTWMSIADRAKERVLEELPNASPEEQQRACELGSILISLENLMSFPWIAERVDKENLCIHGCYFDMECGTLYAYSPRQSAFVKVV
ncbi:MAG: carbonic anhydrase [Pseudomonadota bacterium]